MGSPHRMALSSLKDYMAWQTSIDSAEGIWKQQSLRGQDTSVYIQESMRMEMSMEAPISREECQVVYKAPSSGRQR